MTTPPPKEKARGSTPETLGFLWTAHGDKHSLYGGNHGVWVEFLNADTLGQGRGTVRTPLSGGGLLERSDDLYKVPWARWPEMKMSVSMTGIG